MKRNSLIYIGFIGLLGILSGCEKDETKVTMLDEPNPPVLVSIPDNLILNRSAANDTVEFTGIPVDPGFEASATYSLETCEAGTNFADPLVLYSGSKADVIKFKVSELNELLLKKFDGDVQTQADFRLTALLTVDAGTGAPGTGSNPFLYPSESKTATVSPYGLPRLDLIVEGSPVGKIESAAGNGVYTGLVKLDKTKPFTFLDPEANISYGKNAAGNALEINGSGITSDESGWYQVSADVNAMTYALSAYMIGVVGSATPNGWNAPDIKMDYIAKRGVWVVTTDLIVGEIKFRKNDGWAWNLGGSLNNLTQGGNNIPITQAGNYTITLTIINDLTGSCTIVKN
ncbi:MAG TPA: SusE domain-containing protein [Tenuifilaceae bacterium]|nr:SusE domain-containing protein [Tenuifilaceae bacterium]